MTATLETLTVQATQPHGPIATALRALGVGVVAIEEDLGDVDRFVLSRRLVIERRTAGRFLKGIMDKTLFSEAIHLREQFDLAILVVEGPLNNRYSGFDPQAVRGALSSMMLEYGLNVLATADREDTAEMIRMMARQEQHGIAEISFVPKRTAATLDDQQRRVAEMLPGCGRVAARDLLQHFGSLEAIVAASEASLRAIRGIGVKKARRIHQVLHADYRSVDTERQIEEAIETDPSLLFNRPVRLIARQHRLNGDTSGRHIIDLVFVDDHARELLLVELKRGRLKRADAEQLRRYIDHAADSPLLRGIMEARYRVGGILATVDPESFRCPYDDMKVVLIPRDAVLRVLDEQRARRKRQGEAS